MIRKHVVAILTAFALSVISGAAPAAIIHDNGTADLQDSFTSGVPAGLQSDFDGSGLQVADDFTLGAGASTITDIHWWGFYSPNPATPPADTFTVRIFAEGANNLPLTAPLLQVNAGGAGRTATGDHINVFDSSLNPQLVDVLDIYEYWIHITPLALTPGARYWLSVVDDTIADPDHDWNWVRSVMVGGQANALRFADADPWFVSANFNALFNRAFNLTNDDLVGVIPEPATGGLLAFGLIALGAMRRRRGAPDHSPVRHPRA